MTHVSRSTQGLESMVRHRRHRHRHQTSPPLPPSPSLPCTFSSASAPSDPLPATSAGQKPPHLSAQITSQLEEALLPPVRVGGSSEPPLCPCDHAGVRSGSHTTLDLMALHAHSRATENDMSLRVVHLPHDLSGSAFDCSFTAQKSENLRTGEV